MPSNISRLRARIANFMNQSKASTSGDLEEARAGLEESLATEGKKAPKKGRLWIGVSERVDDLEARVSAAIAQSNKQSIELANSINATEVVLSQYNYLSGRFASIESANVVSRLAGLEIVFRELKSDLRRSVSQTRAGIVSRSLDWRRIKGEQLPVMFIVGAARSGTTTLAHACALSQQADVKSEPPPHLNVESREMYEGYIERPRDRIDLVLRPRIEAALQNASIYVEKQVSLVPFMQMLHRLYGAKFLIPYRDGREVVASLMNWHALRYPIVYREAKDTPQLSSAAAQVESKLAGSIDEFDYGLPRPVWGDPWYESWSDLSRFEMCCWYWNHVNQRILSEIKGMPKDSYRFVNFSKPVVGDILEALTFAGLDDIGEEELKAVVERRLNSVADPVLATELSTDDGEKFPQPSEWDEKQSARFYDFCWPAQKALNLAESEARPLPKDFGSWWVEKGVDTNWYDEIFEYRRNSHAALIAWLKTVEANYGVESAVEVGGGTHALYREHFSSKQFTGIEILPKVVTWLTENNTNSKHQFFTADVIADPVDVTADFVFSQGSIDNVPDSNAFLRALGRMANKFLYVSNYRGYFPELRSHRYLFDTGMQVAFNDISPAEVEAVLREEGFAQIAVVPYPTGREDIPVETAILATRLNLTREELIAGHPLGRIFATYQSETISKGIEDISKEVNSSCAYLSKPSWDRANDLDYFETVVRDLKELGGRVIGTDADLHARSESANVSIRVDVDIDPVAATSMAEIAGALGCPITFYALPTAQYYGRFEGGTYKRYSGVAELFQAMQASGATIGLHVDAYHYYGRHGIDGAEATVVELEWLRSQGLNITGVTGHNGAAFYGADNIEIFEEFKIADRTLNDRDHVYAPVGILKAKDHGISYDGWGFKTPPNGADPYDPFVRSSPEGDFLFDPVWTARYFGDNGYAIPALGVNVWVIGRDMWIVSGTWKGTRQHLFGLTWSETLDILRSIPPEDPIQLVLHGCYFGLRQEAGDDPVREAHV